MSVNGKAAGEDGRQPAVRVAALGDLHCGPEREAEVARVLHSAAGDADVLLLAGDLTSYGLPEEAACLSRICAELQVPTLAVLGNHDWHAGRHDELVAELSAGGLQVLEGKSSIVSAGGCEVGIAGTKGFVGGFAGHSHLDDFGEPSLRALYREASADADALDAGLREIALCRVRIALLHYSPTRDTLAGEPDGIWVFLGNDRLAAPIVAHEPDLVLHGHAHDGAPKGLIGEVPVYNVSMGRLARGYEVFELQARERASATLH
jgi:Icc-related predicted phosphoesterase